MKIISIGIEGWGSAVDAFPYRLRRSHAGDAGSTVVAALILADHPTSVSDSAQYSSGWASRGSVSWTCLHLDDGDVGSALRSWLWQSNPRPIGYLVFAQDAVQANIGVRLRGTAWPSVPFDLYLGREVETVTAVAGPVGGVWTLSVDRGQYGSQVVAHGVDVEDDVRIFGVNPIVQGRRVTVYEYDTATDSEAVAWTGIMEEPSGMSQDMITVDCSASSAIGYFSEESEFGRDRIRARGQIIDSTAHIEGFGSGGPVGVNTSSVVAPRDALMARVGDVPHVVFSDGEQVCAAAMTWTDRWSTGFASSPVTLYDTGSGAEYEIGADKDLRELLICDAESEYSLVRNASGTKSSHPLDLLMCVLTTSGGATWPDAGSHTVGPNGAYDWLQGYFGFGVPSDLVDLTGIAALRDGAYADAECRNFTLFEDPRSPEFIGRLLLPLGLWPTITADGKISLGRIVDFTTAQADATIVDVDVSRRMDSQAWAGFERYGSVRLDLARRGLSNSYADSITDTRFTRPLGSDSLVIDAGDYGDPDTHVVHAPCRRVLANMLRIRWMVSSASRLPVYRVTIFDADALPTGSLVNFTSRVVIGDDGARGVTSHRCIVIEQVRDPATREQTLTLLDLYPVTHADHSVAPSWRVDGSTDGTHFSVSFDEFTDDDWATWVDDKLYALFDRTGLVKSTPREGKINPATGAVTIASAFDAIQVVGDVVRVPDYDLADWWTDRAWIADDASTLGAAAVDAANWSF